MQGKKAEITWSQLDHAQVTVSLQIGVELHKKKNIQRLGADSTGLHSTSTKHHKGHFTRPFTARIHDSPRKEREHYWK